VHDLVIRGGTVVDGTGAKARVADVAVDGERIAAVGGALNRGHREIDAGGLLVTPGFVDVHTHYDGQATWDPFLTPSSWHGVTTTVFGNCGVGFAPVRPGSQTYLIELMEGVEDIPGSVLAEGVSFEWESFPDYLDALSRTPKALDVGAQVPHAALRFYVMGERGADHGERPTVAEIERMGVLLEEALRAGALGFSTSRTVKHRAKDGRAIPSLTAREPELLGLAASMKRAERGVIEVNSDFGPGEFEALRAAAETSGRPLSVLLLQVDNAPELWRETRAQIHAARAAGLDVNGQVGCRPIGLLMGLETSRHPFCTHPAWLALCELAPGERHARLQRDPALRRTLIEQRPDDALTRWMASVLTRSTSWTRASTTSRPRPAASRRVPPRRAAVPGRSRWTPCSPRAARVFCCRRSRTTAPATWKSCARCCWTRPPSWASATAARTWPRSATRAPPPSCCRTGRAIASAASGCRSSCWCASRRATAPPPTACATAVCSRPGCARTSTSSTSRA
jgi:N-acyl-D-aspartate/D-glutamate deacylase